jgi:hypothetical protein
MKVNDILLTGVIIGGAYFLYKGSENIKGVVSGAEKAVSDASSNLLKGAESAAQQVLNQASTAVENSSAAAFGQGAAAAINLNLPSSISNLLAKAADVVAPKTPNTDISKGIIETSVTVNDPHPYTETVVPLNQVQTQIASNGSQASTVSVAATITPSYTNTPLSEYSALKQYLNDFDPTNAAFRLGQIDRQISQGVDLQGVFSYGVGSWFGGIYQNYLETGQGL